MRKKKASTAKKKDITLRDVIMHVQGVEQHLTSSIKDVEQRLTSSIKGIKSDAKDTEQRLSSKIDANTFAIKDLSLRIDALEEDLVATMKDTLTIRSHVGMTTSEE